MQHTQHSHQHKAGKMGRVRPTPAMLRLMNARGRMLARHLDPLGAPPAHSNPYYQKVESQLHGGDWQMLGNDNFGDCCVEGTLVSANTVLGGFKAPYSGSVVTITTESGKKLTVTPNHAILTKTGFARAKFIQKGDYLVGTRKEEFLPYLTMFGRQSYINQAPAPIEKVLGTIVECDGTVFNPVPGAVHFYGDEKFINGDINVIRANGLLRRIFNATLGQPNTQNQLRTTRQLQGLLTSPRALLSFFRGFTTAVGRYMGTGGHSMTLCYAQGIPPQTQGLRLRPQGFSGLDNSLFKMAPRHPNHFMSLTQGCAVGISSNRFGYIPVAISTNHAEPLRAGRKLIASLTHPSFDGGRTDPELAADLLHKLPAFVAADRVINVDVQHLHGFIYDLSTSSRWYTTNGIISHNCVWADTGHQLMIRTANAGSMITPSAQQVLDAYAAHTGFNPNDPGTDNGDDETSAIHYLQQVGFLGHKCDLTTGILVSNLDHIRWCVQLFGACRLGINLPQSAMDQFNSNQPWKDVGDNTIIGGHDVPICHYEGDTFYIITWAKRQPVDISFLKSENYLEEAHAELYFDWANAQGACPSGLDFQALAQDIRAVQ